jgi:hypothetical protein
VEFAKAVVAIAESAATNCASGDDPTCNTVIEIGKSTVSEAEDLALTCARGTNETCNAVVADVESLAQQVVNLALSCLNQTFSVCSDTVGLVLSEEQFLISTVNACLANTYQPCQTGHDVVGAVVYDVTNTIQSCENGTDLTCATAFFAAQTIVNITQACASTSSSSVCQETLDSAGDLADGALGDAFETLVGIDPTDESPSEFAQDVQSTLASTVALVGPAGAPGLPPSPTGCWGQSQNPHGSKHHPGYIKAVGRTFCTSLMPYMSVEAQLEQWDNYYGGSYRYTPWLKDDSQAIGKRYYQVIVAPKLQCPFKGFVASKATITSHHKVELRDGQWAEAWTQNTKQDVACTWPS